MQRHVITRPKAKRRPPPTPTPHPSSCTNATRLHRHTIIVIPPPPPRTHHHPPAPPHPPPPPWPGIKSYLRSSFGGIARHQEGILPGSAKTAITQGKLVQRAGVSQHFGCPTLWIVHVLPTGWVFIYRPRQDRWTPHSTAPRACAPTRDHPQLLFVGVHL